MELNLESQLAALYTAFLAKQEAKKRERLVALCKRFGIDLGGPSQLPCCIEARRTGTHPRAHGDLSVDLPADDVAPAKPSAKASAKPSRASIPTMVRVLVPSPKSGR